MKDNPSFKEGNAGLFSSCFEFLMPFAVGLTPDIGGRESCQSVEIIDIITEDNPVFGWV